MSVDPVIQKLLTKPGYRVILSFMRDGKQIIVVERPVSGQHPASRKQPCNCGGKQNG